MGFTTIAGTLAEAKVTLATPKTTSAQDQLYTFEIKLAHSIPENGKVVLTLPS